MSTYGIISDVHGNLEALAAVLAALERHGVDRIIALGDLVGYNGESNECVEVIRERGIESIAGNHDLIALGRLGTERCAMRPAFTLRRTRRDLTPASRRFLGKLPATRVHDDRIALMHGTLEDPCTYLTTAALVRENARRLHERVPSARVCFYGHTHQPALWDSDGEHVQRREVTGAASLAGDRLTLVNPGSVDASRRQEKVAQAAVFEAESGRLEFLTIPYDHQKVELSAAAKGYRMTRTDEVLHGGWRLARRLARKAARLCGTPSPTGC
jgi:predicted phosphodiesterase